MSNDRISQVAGEGAFDAALCRMTSAPTTEPPATGTRGAQMTVVLRGQ
jgi:hypothetical protein